MFKQGIGPNSWYKQRQKAVIEVIYVYKCEWYADKELHLSRYWAPAKRKEYETELKTLWTRASWV